MREMVKAGVDVARHAIVSRHASGKILETVPQHYTDAIRVDTNADRHAPGLTRSLSHKSEHGHMAGAQSERFRGPQVVLEDEDVREEENQADQDDAGARFDFCLQLEPAKKAFPL